MTYPEKWRETCDPFSLPYRRFQPIKILGYPHAGNDVFCIWGMYRGEEVTAFVKVARQAEANIENEVAILSRLHLPVTPRIIDYGLDELPFSVTLELPGERLSAILGSNDTMESLSYLPEYGATLAKLHKLNVPAQDAPFRRFYLAPKKEILESLGLASLRKYFAHPPKRIVKCFCHGDFHYANILWSQHHISGILDFELAGCSNRDFDIAWAMFVRPGQRFFKTDAEQQAFLSGYAEFGAYDPAAVRYYMAQCYVHFLQMSGDDQEYCDYVRTWLSRLALERDAPQGK